MPENLTAQDICTDKQNNNIKRGFRANGHSGMLLCTWYWSDMDQRNALVYMMLKWYGPMAHPCVYATEMIRTSAMLLWICYGTAWLHKRRGFSWLPQLLFTYKFWIFYNWVIKNTSLHGREAASLGKWQIMYQKWHFAHKQWQSLTQGWSITSLKTSKLLPASQEGQCCTQLTSYRSQHQSAILQSSAPLNRHSHNLPCHKIKEILHVICKVLHSNIFICKHSSIQWCQLHQAVEWMMSQLWIFTNFPVNLWIYQ